MSEQPQGRRARAATRRALREQTVGVGDSQVEENAGADLLGIQARSTPPSHVPEPPAGHAAAVTPAQAPYPWELNVGRQRRTEPFYPVGTAGPAGRPVTRAAGYRSFSPSTVVPSDLGFVASSRPTASPTPSGGPGETSNPAPAPARVPGPGPAREPGRSAPDGAGPSVGVAPTDGQDAKSDAGEPGADIAVSQPAPELAERAAQSAPQPSSMPGPAAGLDEDLSDLFAGGTRLTVENKSAGHELAVADSAALLASGEIAAAHGPGSVVKHGVKAPEDRPPLRGRTNFEPSVPPADLLKATGMSPATVVGTVAGTPDAAPAPAVQGAEAEQGGQDEQDDDGRRSPSLLREVGVVLVVTVILSFLLKTFLVQSFSIPSESMQDTLYIGDRILVSKLAPGMLDIHHGDIVVFEDDYGWLNDAGAAQAPINPVQRTLIFVGLLPDTQTGHLVKRAIGLPGDTVSCAGPGEPVTVNGVALDESSYLAPGSIPSEREFSVTVPPGMVFVLGDNRQHSSDSRYHADDGNNGFVPMSNIVGVAVARTWPVSRWTILRNPGQVFAQVPAPAPSGTPTAGAGSAPADSAEASTPATAEPTAPGGDSAASDGG